MKDYKLSEIKEICNKKHIYNDCDGCPFYCEEDYSFCRIKSNNDFPFDWQIEQDEQKTMTANELRQLLIDRAAEYCDCDGHIIPSVLAGIITNAGYSKMPDGAAVPSKEEDK